MKCTISLTCDTISKLVVKYYQGVYPGYKVSCYSYIREEYSTDSYGFKDTYYVLSVNPAISTIRMIMGTKKTLTEYIDFDHNQYHYLSIIINNELEKEGTNMEVDNFDINKSTVYVKLKEKEKILKTKEDGLSKKKEKVIK